MNIAAIDETLSVSPQIAPADIPDIAAGGFRAIVCNRPDGEGPDQPTSEEIAAAAAAAGLAFRYLPVTPGMVTDADADAFGTALRINDPKCVNKTFPEFFDRFAQVTRAS